MADLTDIHLDFLPDDPEGIYLVGGALRDLLVGRPPADIDLVVTGDISRSAAQIAQKTAGSIIDLGKKGFDLLRVAAPETTIDITPLNHSSIEEDLLQRDFTINAMAYDVKARRLVDCTGGLADMRAKVIRMVSKAAFVNDPARLVRAYRMAAVFHLSLSLETREAIGKYGHLVNKVAGERVWAELIKIFSVVDSGPIIWQMANRGLLTAIFPELSPAIGCTQNHHHQFDVFTHSLRVYEHLEALLTGADDLVRDLVPTLAVTAKNADLSDHTAMLKYAALLHDVGKPATRHIDLSGRVRFFGHAAKSADITRRISRRLKLASKQRKVADTLIRHHIRPLFLFLASQKESLGPNARIRFFKRCNHLTLPIIVHTMADIMAKGDDLQGRDRAFISFCEGLLKDYIDYTHRQTDVPPLISGHDLIVIFGLSPSPRFKHILNRVDERRLSGELANRDQAIKWVEAYLLSETGRPPTDLSL